MSAGDVRALLRWWAIACFLAFFAGFFGVVGYAVSKAKEGAFPSGDLEGGWYVENQDAVNGEGMEHEQQESE